MSKFSKLLRAIQLLASNPSLINKILEDEDVNKRTVISEYGLEKGLKKIPFKSICKQNSIIVEPFAFLDGGSLPTDHALLTLLAQHFTDCSYFEIGTWRGESASNVARFAKEVFTLNLSAEELKLLGHDDKYINEQGHFSKNNTKIKQLYGNSFHFNFSPYHKKFDLIFIDGDHRYDAVKNDTAKAFELLKNENSIIVWHDYGSSPELPRWEVLNGILDGAPKEKHNRIYSVENTLCAIYFPDEISASYIDYPQTPTHHFSVNLQIKD